MMTSLPEEPAAPVREERANVDQDGHRVSWVDSSVWAPPLVLALLLTLLVRMCGVNIPFNDDFDSPGRMLFDWLQGNFGWHSLWEQDNDSRLFVPRIIWLVEAFTVGWSTKTGWNRRSRAASFSICLRYSSRVVAPMQ